MVQLHYCQNHSVCISVPQSPKSWQQTDRTNTGRGYTLQKPHVQLFCNQTKLSLCVWENVSLSEHDLIVFPDCEAERGRVCVFIVVFHHNLKWAFIVLGLHFRNHPFSNSDGWCQEIWGALSHFFSSMQISNGSNANIFGQDAFNLAFAEVYFITPYGHLYSLATLFIVSTSFCLQGRLNSSWYRFHSPQTWGINRRLPPRELASINVCSLPDHSL